MLLNKQKITLIFRYFWILIAVVVIIYIAQQNIVLERTISYSIDLSQAITRDIEGPYPTQRVSLNPDKTLAVLAEPLYLQAYLPTEFKGLQVIGSISLNQEVAQLGLKQLNGSWFWQDVNQDEFVLDYDLTNALVKNNKIELIFSFPNLTEPEKINIRSLELTLNR